MLKKILAIALICAIGLPARCSAPLATGANTFTVFAAASLTDAFDEIGTQFSARYPGANVVFNFGGSQQLRTQLEQGAVADVFASANTREMDAAIDTGLVTSGAQHTFVRNRLAVIVPRDNPGNVQALSDLAKPGLKVVLAAPGVPVGAYSLAALDKMNAQFSATFASTVVANVVSYEDNVKQVVAKIQLGEADAGIVYTSDVTPSTAEQVMVLDIPDEFNVLAEYPIAPLRAASNPDLAQAFVTYVLSDEGQSILRKWGFISP